MRRKINRIANLERAAELARIDRIRRELAKMPRVEPSRESLLKLKRDLNIPDCVFVDMFDVKIE